MADNPRIEELRKRVEKDPASIAFAQLAEEYRRSGNLADAIRVCRAGLTRHPGYLSARVTLGRALLEHNEMEAARTELEAVRQSAPENLAAVRGLAEIHHRTGDLQAALTQYRAALQLARHDPDLAQTIADLEREIGAKPKAASKLSLEEVQAEFLSAFGSSEAPTLVMPAPLINEAPPVTLTSAEAPVNLDAHPPAAHGDATAALMELPAPPDDPAVARLEHFLHSIVTYRASLPSNAVNR